MAHPGDTGGGRRSLQLLRGRHQQARHKAVALRVLGERGHVEVLVVVAGVVLLEAPDALAGLAGAGEGEDGQEGDKAPHGVGDGGGGGGEEGTWFTVWREGGAVTGGGSFIGRRISSTHQIDIC